MVATALISILYMIRARELEESEEQDRRVSTLADDAKGSAKGNAIGQGHAASLDSLSLKLSFCPLRSKAVSNSKP